MTSPEFLWESIKYFLTVAKVKSRIQMIYWLIPGIIALTHRWLKSSLWNPTGQQKQYLPATSCSWCRENENQLHEGAEGICHNQRNPGYYSYVVYLVLFSRIHQDFYISENIKHKIKLLILFRAVIIANVQPASMLIFSITSQIPTCVADVICLNCSTLT